MEKSNELKRLREIMSVFVKHGLKDGIAVISNPAQLRAAIEELGPTFIKIGQVLSTRPDIISQPFIDEFQKLRDNVRPEQFDEIKAIIEGELGKPLDEIFLSFEAEPVACASIAQVHVAELKNGESVVVKVRRPKIKEMMISDINILKRLARLLKITPQGAVMNPVEIIDELGNTLKTELDFLNEAKNIKTFTENNKDTQYIKCPKVFNKYTTESLLVMEYIDGIKISDKDQLEKKGYYLDDIALKLANNYMKQIFIDGYFHGDPHPGNILIAGDTIAYIDFGMMGTLNKSMRQKYIFMLEGIATGNIDMITNAVLRIGKIKGNLNINKLRPEIEEFYSNYAYLPVEEINIPEVVEELFKVCRRNSIAMPREITMLVKGVMTIEGVISDLSPDINVMKVTVPFIRKLKLEEIDVKEDIVEQLGNLYLLSKQGLKMPLHIGELVNKALEGKLKVNMEHTNLDKNVIELNKMANRLAFSIIVAALIVGSSLIIRADSGQGLRILGINNINIMGLAGYLGAAVMGLWLLISILRSGRI
ncbi:MAG TPA: AarF/ABC1/UbiB kinase family protein [Clostridiales bacterium]|nr:AarF/ABC1/UbiB kinase family protein [Clostridiales bacterium]